MALFLDRIDSYTPAAEEFSFQFASWIANLIDSLNEDISDIDEVVMSLSITPTPSPAAIVTQDVEANTRYIPTNGLLTNYQLPDLMNRGDRVTIAGQGAGGWALLTGAGQTIQIGDVGATASTSVASANRYDSIEIMCVVANTTFITLSTQTLGFVIV